MKTTQRASMGFALATIALLGAGCPEESDGTGTGGTGAGQPTCDLPYLGDQAADPQLELIYYGADEMDHPLEDGGVVDLILPPQGGRVLFIGVRATNVDPCEAVLTGAMRDTDTQQVRFDTRTINLVADGDGWGKSATGDIASYANVPACHNTWTPKDIFGSDFQLEVVLKDRAGKEVQKTISARPSCAEPENEAECLCICQGGYVLGQECGEGGGGEGGGGQGGAGGGT